MQETPQQYIQRILGYLKEREPLRVQRSTAKALARLVKGLDSNALSKRPAPGKWSIAEILAHLADGELVGGWRFRSILAQNGTPLQAYDQDAWAKTFNYRRRDPKTSLERFRILRESNLELFDSVPRSLWENYGMHQERGKETIAHLVRLFAGHDLNHLQQVEAIIKQRRKPRKTKSR